jgi:hypothetical protein
MPQEGGGGSISNASATRRDRNAERRLWAARIARRKAPDRDLQQSGLLFRLEPDRSHQSWGAATLSRRSLMGRAMLLWIIGIPIPIILLIWLLGGFH